jgi:hypothetical protein
MTPDIQIYIGDDLLDLSPGTTVGLTFQVADIGDLATRKLSYTNQFTIPYTENNDRIYQNARDISSQTPFPYTQQLVRIVQNGVEICNNGIHVLKKASKGYQLFILFRETGFFKAIENKKLWDLNATPFKAKYYDPRTYRNTTSGLIYPIAYANRNNIGTGGVNTGFVRIPFWYYKDIINQIFIDAGYTKVGNVFSNTKYLNMVVNACGSIAGYNTDFVALRSVDVYVATTQVIVISGGTPVNINFTGIRNSGNNPLGYWDGTSKYLTNDTDIPSGQAVFDANCRLNVSFTGSGSIDIRVSLFSGANTIIDIVDLLSVGATPKTASLDYSGNFIGGTLPYQLNGTGHGLRVQIQRINSTTGTINVVSGSMQIYPLTNPTTFTNSGAGIAPYAYYADLLPDMKQSDFIKDFMVRFGLLSSEKNGVITFKSYNEIIATITGKDYTDKRVDDPEETTFNPLSYAQENLFKYSSADEISDSVDGSGSINIANTNITDSKTIYTSPFAKTLTATGQTTLGNIICANIPILDPTDLPEYLNTWNADAGPRLLLVRDRYSYEPVYPVGASATDYKVAYFEDGNQTNQMTFQQFIDDDYSLLTEILQKAKLVTRNYIVDENDISTLSFLEPIFDTDSFFLLDTVGPFVPGKKTKFNMLKIG